MAGTKLINLRIDVVSDTIWCVVLAVDSAA